MTSYDRSRINCGRSLRRVGEMLMHRTQFVMLISWARYARAREEALPGIVIRKCVTTKSLVRLSRTPGVRSSGTAIEIDVIYSLFRYLSSNSYNSGVTGTRNRSDSYDCMPLRIYCGASKRVNQLTPSYTDSPISLKIHISVKFSIYNIYIKKYIIFNNVIYICRMSILLLILFRHLVDTALSRYALALLQEKEMECGSRD